MGGGGGGTAPPDRGIRNGVGRGARCIPAEWKAAFEAADTAQREEWRGCDAVDFPTPEVRETIEPRRTRETPAPLPGAPRSETFCVPKLDHERLGARVEAAAVEVVRAARGRRRERRSILEGVATLERSLELHLLGEEGEPLGLQ